MATKTNSKAKGTEYTVEEKLDALYLLQTIDKKIDELLKLRGELPLEVNDLEDEIEGLNTRAENLKNEMDGITTGITDNKLKAKEALALKKKYEKQLNNVKNNREYDALTKEIENQDLDIQLLEKKNKESEENLESKEEYMKKSKDVLKSKKKDLIEKNKELEKITKKTEKEEKSLNNKRKKVSATIEDRLLNAYNRTNSLRTLWSCFGRFRGRRIRKTKKIKERPY